MSDLRVIDNDRDEITVTMEGHEIRGWSYHTDLQRRVKMLAAREFVEGYLYARENFPVGKGFWVAFILLAVWASWSLAYGLFVLASSIPQIGAPL